MRAFFLWLSQCLMAHVHPLVCLHVPIQDYVDLVEYLLGNETTTWGAQRIQDGHVAPYTNVVAFEIGNEQYVACVHVGCLPPPHEALLRVRVFWVWTGITLTGWSRCVGDAPPSGHGCPV